MPRPKTKNATIGSEYTIEPVKPGWTSQLSPGSCEFCEIPVLYSAFGIRRTMAFRGIREGWFKSVLLRKPGAKSGKRLIFLPSVRAWLMEQMENGEGSL